MCRVISGDLMLDSRVEEKIAMRDSGRQSSRVQTDRNIREYRRISEGKRSKRINRSLVAVNSPILLPMRYQKGK